MAKKRGSRRKGDRPTMASLANRHELYEASVQSVPDEVEFMKATFRQLTGRQPRVLREDFCGTAAAACEWVKSNRLHQAVAVDFDADVLESGRSRHIARMSDAQRRRLRLVLGDVRSARTGRADVACAFNFSWWTFRTREELLAYFRAVKRSLAPDGVFFLDIYGGSEAYNEVEEETDYDLFTYVWEQAQFEPLSARYVCHIHFRFPDGSELPRAFTYEWRLWTLPELTELLAEAGFARSVLYWQGTDEDGDPNGEFTAVEEGEADPAWIAYVAACRKA